MAVSRRGGRGSLPPGCVQSPGCWKGGGYGDGKAGAGLICNWLFFFFIWYVVFFSSATGNAEAWARAHSPLRPETTKEERQLLPT